MFAPARWTNQSQKETKLIFQPSILRCKLLVLGEGTHRILILWVVWDIVYDIDCIGWTSNMILRLIKNYETGDAMKPVLEHT